MAGATHGGTQRTAAGGAGCEVELAGVAKVYQRRSAAPLEALTEITFTVKPGEFVSVVGASGCGKSTLLRIVGGLSRQTTGTVAIDGRLVDGPRRDVGIVFQAPELLPWRSVLDNAMIGAEILGLNRTAARARAMELIELVGLRGFEKSRPAELSGGMQQRNAIVRALLHGPQLLLMDEPFGALDALTRETMGVELLNIWAASGCSVVFVTHSVNEALFLSDRIVVMSARPGRVQEIVDVDLPRPRRLEMLNGSEVGPKAARIRTLLGATVGGVE